MQNRNMNIGYSERFQNKSVSIVFLKNSFNEYIVSIQNKEDGRFKDYKFSYKAEGKQFFELLKRSNKITGDL